MVHRSQGNSPSHLTFRRLHSLLVSRTVSGRAGSKYRSFNEHKPGFCHVTGSLDLGWSPIGILVRPFRFCSSARLATSRHFFRNRSRIWESLDSTFFKPIIRSLLGETLQILTTFACSTDRALEALIPGPAASYSTLLSPYLEMCGVGTPTATP